MSLRQVLQLNVYPQCLTVSVIYSKDSSLSDKEDKPLSCVHISYVKGVSEKFKRAGNRYNIRPIIKRKYTPRSSLMNTGQERGPQQIAECVYSISCESDRSYIGKIGGPPAVRLLTIDTMSERFMG
jgi:hypothetical protein